MEEVENKLIQVEQLYGIFGVFTAISLGLIVLILWVFYKAYFIKKAESLFEEKLVEYKTDLEGSMQKSINELKSKLDVISGQETSFLNEKRKSLLTMYTSYINVVTTIMNRSSFDIDENNLHIRREFTKELNTLNYKLNISVASYHIFGRDEELEKMTTKLSLCLIELQTLKEKELLDVETIYKLRLLLKEDLKIAETMNAKAVHRCKDKLEENFKEIITVMEKYGNERLKKYKSTIESQIQLSARIAIIIKESFEDKE